MVHAGQIAEIIDRYAPFATAEAWDNCGLILDCGRETDGILFALDVSKATIEEAALLGCGILVTHHPPLIAPQKTFHHEDSMIYAAMRGISLITAHTCLDRAEGGVNDVLAQMLGLRDVAVFAELGRSGSIDAMPSEDFIRFVQGRIGTESPVCVDSGGEIRRVAVLGGGGGDYLEAAIREGCDAFVTGELKHHEALLAAQNGLCVVAAGHFQTEHPAMEKLCERVGQELGYSAKCFVSRDGQNPFRYMR